MSPDVPTSGVAAYITALAKQHDVRYVKTPDDAIAEVITQLAGDEAEMDDVELLLLALERAGVVASQDVVPLHVYYLREKLRGQVA